MAGSFKAKPPKARSFSRSLASSTFSLSGIVAGCCYFGVSGNADRFQLKFREGKTKRKKPSHF